MKRVFLLLSPLLALLSCSRQINVDIEGVLRDNSASMIYLIVENEQLDTLASAPISTDNTFRLQCKVAQPSTAFLCDDNGNAITMLLTEDEPLRLRPSEEGGHVVEGGPINDKYNITMRQLSDLTKQVAMIDPNSEHAGEMYESLVAKYHDALSTTITYNLDNIIGVELFIHQESLGMTAEDMKVRFAQFSQDMQRLAPMRRFEKYIDILQRSQIGNQFIDADLSTITGEQIRLSDICGKGKWVLLDFWATWCAPCLQDIQYLKTAYERYALMGFEICAVSLDPDTDRLRAFVEREDLLWRHLLNQASEDATPLSEQYGVISIPANFLISPEGKIVARDLHGENLIHELQHHIEGAEFCTYPQLHDNHNIVEQEEK